MAKTKKSRKPTKATKADTKPAKATKTESKPAKEVKAKTKPTPPPEDDLMMTIASDDEVPEMEESSEDEEVEDEAEQNELTEDFEFDGGDFTGHTSSWDFTKAISNMKAMDEASGPAKRTSIQTKIDKRRKETGQSLKKDVTSDDKSDSDESSDSEEVVEEEERLQSALSQSKNARVQHEDEVDEEERKKAAKFFAEDPFAAEEFAKTQFATFTDLKLSRPLLRAVDALGFSKPTPIQQRVIPIALAGKDICASAQTGSGKTAAFLLPTLERLQFRSRKVQETRVLIICPVRELATQCQSMLEQLARFTDISCSLAVGGLPLQAQENELRSRPDVVVCTPGRMIDHLRNSRSVHVDMLEILVLDEADRLLEMGFMDEVSELVNLCPEMRQTMLFSATMTAKVDQLVSLSMKTPVRVSTDPLFDMSKQLVQEFVRIRPQREDDREAILLALCTRTFRSHTIVFMETKVAAHRLMIVFGLAGLNAAELHGNLQQHERLEALQRFRSGEVDILLCTDVAARGIDIEGVHSVINYEMPKDLTTYVHRVGRTARAGRTGRAVTLTSERRRLLMKQVARHCHGFVKSRSVPDAVISQWRKRIEKMEEDVKEIRHEETLEKRMREAEKEASRASNMLKHEDEIKSRPARTWFQTEREKKMVKEKAKEDPTGLTPQQEKEKLKQMGRKKRRLHDIRKEEQKALEAEGSTFTEKHVAGAAKKAKRMEMNEKRQEESIAELADRKQAEREKKRKKGGFDVDFSERKERGPKKVKEKEDKKEKKEKTPSEKRNGRRGTASFKSKGRYRRRK